jgi:hypothetical protein
MSRRAADRFDDLIDLVVVNPIELVWRNLYCAGCELVRCNIDCTLHFYLLGRGRFVLRVLIARDAHEYFFVAMYA